MRKLATAANWSADWCERFAENTRLEPGDLAWQQMQRSGRVDEPLRRVSPGFVVGYETYRVSVGRQGRGGGAL